MTRSHREPYPHEGGCKECQRQKVCNVCGRDASQTFGRCTNGRCLDCHQAVCTLGGSTGPGHGYGTRADAEAAWANRMRGGLAR